jgi:hypothetical protein
MTNYEITQAVFTDVALVVVSLVVIFALVWIVSGSLFISSMGLLQIFSSYPTALVTLVFIFQQSYVGILHVMAVSLCFLCFLFFEKTEHSHFCGNFFAWLDFYHSRNRGGRYLCCS